MSFWRWWFSCFLDSRRVWSSSPSSTVPAQPPDVIEVAGSLYQRRRTSEAGWTTMRNMGSEIEIRAESPSDVPITLYIQVTEDDIKLFRRSITIQDGGMIRLSFAPIEPLGELDRP